MWGDDKKSTSAFWVFQCFTWRWPGLRTPDHSDIECYQGRCGHIRGDVTVTCWMPGACRPNGRWA
jgi:hypothetical protein